ncbi:GOPC [Cordylochernes scorpioides]|uniref:GOPC n=1 Tax=Cordylochernes scorpioides TaxID=51811 RepID=A0ABY6KIM4_9ARAC|nr:GOPC [Cordylochernes scorpioides]
MEAEAARRRNKAEEGSLMAAHVTQAEKDCERMQIEMENLRSELYGTKLAAMYLDKELAGRIQQIQLLNSDIKGPAHDKLWNQLEAEIHLNRHKTVVRVCRHHHQGGLPHPESPPDRNGFGTIRTVNLYKEENEFLGISITGGMEKGVPILISHIEPDQPAARSKELYVGDAILSANGIDLRNALHEDAVKVLSSQVVASYFHIYILEAPR